MAGMAGSVRPPARPLAKPLVHRKSLIGFRVACERMWGPIVLQDISSALPADVSDRTAGMRPLPEWIFLDDLIAWHVAVWNGPARHDEHIMTPHIHATVDEGFGRVKRLLLSASTPLTLAPRVAALWGEEYSTGRLEATALEERCIHLTLTDHPYVEIALMRYVIAEVFRYIVSLTRANDVKVVHTVRDAGLVIVLRWA
jgi:hypothetical protein